ncbi:MAG: hypothetical protein WC615_07410 [Mucilaginibacter sp.]|jgi:hypothetical protein|uniref:hypothetical protein n=1 Tax=Mucilaginibacter sp. TaxID=1882438 RepID=UPI003566CDFA
MRYKYFFVLLIIITSLSAFQSPVKNTLRFRSATAHIIKVYKGHIFYDEKLIHNIKYSDDIIYKSKYNSLIEDHGSVFLFLGMADNPNRDKLIVFRITPTKATPGKNAILSEIKDYDKDGFLEFGGRDLTEAYPTQDSMYYIPTAYYEIRNGKIKPDNTLAKSEDIKLNGLYLPPNKRLDKDGNCCKVVPTPVRKRKLPVQKQSNFIPKSFRISDTITVFATKYVLDNKDEITNVNHSKDGSWLFYSNNRTYTRETAARKVKLSSIVKLDKSILLLSRMPKGYVATRQSKTASWSWSKLKDKD